jgi:hypothetical protein
MVRPSFPRESGSDLIESLTWAGCQSLEAIVTPAQTIERPRELWKSLCPVPVKHVLRGYRIHGGFPVVAAEYDSEVGLKTNPEDDEF